MKIQTIHKNAGGTVVNPISASGIQIDGPCGERLVLNITDSGVEISVSGFAATSSSGDSRDRSLRARLDFHCDPAIPPADDNGPRTRVRTRQHWIADELKLPCYECGKPVKWPAPDSRCGDCTHLTPAEAQPVGDGEFGVGIQPNPKARYWQDRAEFWRTQAVALGWREKRDAANGEAPPPSAPVGVEGLVSEWEKRAGELNDEGLYGCCAETYEQCAAQVSALAQQPAATLPDEDDSDLTVAYMAGRHDGRKEAQQPAAEVYVDFPQVGTAGPLAVVDGKVTLPDTTMNDLIRHARTGYVEQPAAVDGAMVERIAALLHEEATDEPWTVAGVEHDGPDRDYYRTLARKVIVRAAQQPAAVYEAYPTRSGPPAHGGCERCGRCREGDFARCKNRQYAYLAGQQGGSDNG